MMHQFQKSETITKNNIRTLTHKMHLSLNGFLTEFSPTQIYNSIIVRLVFLKQKLFHFNKLIGKKIKLSIIIFSIDFIAVIIG